MPITVGSHDVGQPWEESWAKAALSKQGHAVSFAQASMTTHGNRERLFAVSDAFGPMFNLSQAWGTPVCGTAGHSAQAARADLLTGMRGNKYSTIRKPGPFAFVQHRSGVFMEVACYVRSGHSKRRTTGAERHLEAPDVQRALQSAPFIRTCCGVSSSLFSRRPSNKFLKNCASWLQPFLCDLSLQASLERSPESVVCNII